jgi:hypothetical protein
MTFQESSDKDSIEGMTNDDNETCMMNVDANMDDLKYYVGTSDILES